MCLNQWNVAGPQKWNITLLSMVQLVYNYMKMRIVVFSVLKVTPLNLQRAYYPMSLQYYTAMFLE